MERTGSFWLTSDPDLRPERAQNWEFGVNVERSGILADDDDLGVKLTYFNNDIQDYISRTVAQNYKMYIHNIDRAKFEGFELSGRYETGSFSAELAGTYYTDVTFCRTANTCINSSLAADYATNQIPPEYSASLTLTQKFLDDALTLSGRIRHVGPRSAKAETPGSGAAPFISAIPWHPYTLIDVFGSYRLSGGLLLDFSVENLTDTYYVEPLNLGLIPAPGRTFRVGLTGDFSPKQGAGGGSQPFLSLGRSANSGLYDWSGFYLGGHGAYLNGSAETKDLKLTQGSSLRENRDYYLGDFSGGLGGVQAGYNYQLSDYFVIGVEADYSWANVRLDAPLLQYGTDGMTAEFDWMASARLRAGVSFDRLLAYGTAGWAGGGVEQTWTRDQLVFKDSGRATGWTIGGGVEYALTNNLTLKGEYSFATLKTGKLSDSVPVSWSPDNFNWEQKTKFQVDQFKLGLNYKF